MWHCWQHVTSNQDIDESEIKNWNFNSPVAEHWKRKDNCRKDLRPHHHRCLSGPIAIWSFDITSITKHYHDFPTSSSSSSLASSLYYHHRHDSCHHHHNAHHHPTISQFSKQRVKTSMYIWTLVESRLPCWACPYSCPLRLPPRRCQCHRHIYPQGRPDCTCAVWYSIFREYSSFYINCFTLRSKLTGRRHTRKMKEWRSDVRKAGSYSVTCEREIVLWRLSPHQYRSGGCWRRQGNCRKRPPWCPVGWSRLSWLVFLSNLCLVLFTLDYLIIWVTE